MEAKKKFDNLTLSPNLNLSSFNISDCPALSSLEPTPNSLPGNNNNELSNSDKIALGTGVGLGVPGLCLAAFGAWVGYKQLNIVWREYKENKEKEKNKTNQTETEPNILGEGNSRTTTERVVNNEVAQQEIQAQIQTPPKQRCGVM